MHAGSTVVIVDGFHADDPSFALLAAGGQRTRLDSMPMIRCGQGGLAAASLQGRLAWFVRSLLGQLPGHEFRSSGSPIRTAAGGVSMIGIALILNEVFSRMGIPVSSLNSLIR